MKIILLLSFFVYHAYDLYKTFWPRRLPAPVVPLPGPYKRMLETSFPYYNKLPYRLKGKFEKRVMAFISRKRFYSRSEEFAKVTDEMKVLIAASAVQLTFGLPYVELMHFNRILVYSTDYYSRINRRYHKGETNPMFNCIVFSWNNFMHGHFHADGVHLGLHEMAHALRLENTIKNEEFNFLSRKALARWEALASEKIALIREGKNQFLRDYGGVNREEFFAVSVEAFFEVPEDFRLNLPELYEAMAELLKQDPLNLNALHRDHA